MSSQRQIPFSLTRILSSSASSKLKPASAHSRKFFCCCGLFIDVVFVFFFLLTRIDPIDTDCFIFVPIRHTDPSWWSDTQIFLLYFRIDRNIRRHVPHLVSIGMQQPIPSLSPSASIDSRFLLRARNRSPNRSPSLALNMVRSFLRWSSLIVWTISPCRSSLACIDTFHSASIRQSIAIPYGLLFSPGATAIVDSFPGIISNKCCVKRSIVGAKDQ